MAERAAWVVAGMLAATVGVLAPLRSALARPLRHSVTAEDAARRRGGRAARLSLALGVACLLATSAILAFDPAGAIVGSVALLVALLALLAPLLDLLLAGMERAQRRLRSAATGLAAIELRTPATRTRSLAIAATGAVAVFGSVAIRGARANSAGLDQTARDMNRVSDVWVSVAGSANTLGTTSFSIASAPRLARLAGVRTLAIYRGGFLDFGDRRVWVIAPPRSSPAPIPASQLLEGSPALADARLRGRLAALSR